MSLPKFEFKTADRFTEQRFIHAAIQSRKFYRTVDGKILFGPPHDWVPLHRWQEMFWILQDGEAIDYSGDTSDETMKFLHAALSNQRWKLPRAGGQPAPVAVRS